MTRIDIYNTCRYLRHTSVKGIHEMGKRPAGESLDDGDDGAAMGVMLTKLAEGGAADR